MKNPKIVHLHIKEPAVDDYFSSIRAIYEHHNADELGLQYRSLVNALHDSGVYENKRIIVRIGTLKSSTQNPKHRDFENQ